MFLKNEILVSACFATVFSSAAAFGWSEHHLITQAALQSLPQFNSEMVTPTPFEPMIQALGYKDQLDFNTKIKIKKAFVFGFKDETLGVPVTAASVLERYSDEPDWFMDRELFEEYPDLWKSEYAEMGGKTGTPSQSFRHMYWGPWEPGHPITSLVVPAPGKPRGEAPDRAALFINLARQTREAGLREGAPQKYRYWTLRFIANALHYLEDVSQPFHASQIQTLDFLKYPFRKYGVGRQKGIDGYVKQVTNVVAYYHFSFEDYVAYVMAKEPNSREAQKIQAALTSAPNHLDGSIEKSAATHDTAELVKSMAKYSQAKAKKAAKAAEAFFPKIDDYFTVHDVKLDQFDPQAYMDTNWWNETAARGQAATKPKERYFEIVTDIFGQLGTAVRSVIKNEGD